MKKIKLLFAHLLLVALVTASVSPTYVFADELPSAEIMSEDLDAVPAADEISEEADLELAENDGFSEALPVDEEDEETGDEADTASGDSPIKEVKKLPASERVICVDNKGTLDEALAMLPEKWSVTYKDGSEKKVKVSWTCKDDFDEKLSSYVFQGAIDGVTLSDKMAERLIMEILYVDQATDVSESSSGDGINETPRLLSVLSPYSITSEIAEEQGVNDDDENFLKDYGDYADRVIEVDKNFRSANGSLPSSTEAVFRKISPSSNSYYYQHLSSAEKKFYNKIDRMVTQYLYYGKKPVALKYYGQTYKKYIVTPYISHSGLSQKKAFDVFCIYYMDNPQAFFLTTSGYEEKGRLAFTFLPNADKASEIKDRAKVIAKNLANMNNKVKKKSSNDYERLKWAQRFFCERVEYDRHASDPRYPWQWKEGTMMYCQSLMSAFSGTRKKTVCAGYDKSMIALSRLSGIEATGVSGDDHEWTKVYLYGRWYCLDATWDDLDSGSSVCVYDYFLKSDDSMNSINNNKGGHHWDSYIKGKAPKSSRDYSAKRKQYKITYKLNGGKNHRMNPKIYTEKNGKIKLYKPTRKGYKFQGWYKDKNFKKKVTEIKKNSTGNKTFYAKWKKK